MSSDFSSAEQMPSGSSIKTQSAECQLLVSILSRAADRWTLLTVRVLGSGPRRFNALRREVGQVSQKMLASTLRDLEENGFVKRTVKPVTPPQVEYALTDLGRDFLKPINEVVDWIVMNGSRIEAARSAYAACDGVQA